MRSPRGFGFLLIHKDMSALFMKKIIRYLQGGLHAPFILSAACLFCLPMAIGAQGKRSPEGFAITGLPLIGYNDDFGLIYGVRLIGTYYEAGYAPYRYQVWVQYLSSSLGYENHAAKMDYVRRSGPRIISQVGYSRHPLAAYYGYGNEQDIRRIQGITGKRSPAIAVGSNLARGRELSAGEIVESQNRYYNYDYTSPYASATLEDFLSNSNFKWFVGFLGLHYTIRSYHRDTEQAERIANTLTYIDIEQPLGYESVRNDKGRTVNYLRAAWAYDSRPRLRENNPNSGIFADIHYENTGQLLGSDYNYSNLTLTWRQYISIAPSFWKRRKMESIFAYRLMARETMGGTAPFFEAGKIRNMRESADGLGGLGGLRGFPFNQFIDKFITLANLEWRHTFLRTGVLGGMDLQSFVFYDIGRVAPSRAKWQFGDLHSAYGLGGANVWQKNTVILLFFGFSEFERYTALNLRHTF